jgi:hypothetical protein
MTCKLVKYSDVRHLIQPGTIVAFGGNDTLSRLVKAVLRGPVSHVGVVMSTTRLGEPPDYYINEVIESCPMDRHGSGVRRSRLSERIARYDGNVWLLPLGEGWKFNSATFYNFLLAQDGKGYAYKRAVLSTLPFGGALDRTGVERVFCSELIIKAFKVAGMLPMTDEHKTPLELCQMNIFGQYYYQVSARKIVDDVTIHAYKPSPQAVEIPRFSDKELF